MNITISEIETIKCILKTVEDRLETTQCAHVNTQIEKIINRLIDEQHILERELFKK